MSRIRFVVLAVFAAATVAACSSPTAPTAKQPTDAPQMSGYQVGHG